MNILFIYYFNININEYRNGYLKDLGLSIDEAAEASGRE